MPDSLKHIIPAAAVAAALVLTGPADGADPPEATLRQLEKDIAAVRGLPFKAPVTEKVIPRPKDADAKLQGYYSPKDKKLYLYDDLAGNYERGVLVHEMVHALQDQHFGLDKLHQSSYDSDAELAKAALIEGDATFTMIEVLKGDQPRVAAMLDVPLDKAKNLRNAFLYAQGARYVKALKERGGWEAVNARYRFPPEATASILHPEGVSAIDLGPGPTRGELAIIEMLAGNSATKPLAFAAAAGWRGDRVIEEGSSKAWIVAFAIEEDARRFQEALAKYRTAEQPELRPAPLSPGGDAWRDGKGVVVAVLLRDSCVLALDAPDGAAFRALLDRVEGPPALLVRSTRDGRDITFGELIDRLLAADLVCVGEEHDSAPNHRVQYEIIKGLFARDERLGVGMEMFQRPFQPVIDRYLKREIGEEQFLKETEYQKRWGYDWSLYRPIVDFCVKNGLPLAALNAPKELTKRIGEVGYKGLTGDEKEQLGPIAFQVKAHRDYWFDRLAKMHGKTNATAEERERSYEVMAVWDDYMAASAARFQQVRGLRRLVVLAGSGHIDRGFGIPERAARQTGGKVATVHVEVGAEPAKAFAEPVADFIVIVR
jgi:uncharacterized iron-regulated protein